MSNSRQGIVQRRMNKFRTVYPYCWRCLFMGRLKEATETHHIHPVGMGGAPDNSLLHNKDNFITLCRECHRWAQMNPGMQAGYCKMLKLQEDEYYDKVNAIQELN